MIPGRLDYTRLAELHRPQNAQGFALAVRQLAAQGLRAHDIAAALRLTVAAVAQLLDHQPHSGGLTMRPDPRTSAPALAGGLNHGDMDERAAAQEQHARDARANVEKSRQPSEILTDDEREMIARGKTGGSGTP